MPWATYALAKRALPAYSSKFSRHDFTLPQLFARLILRELQKETTYRGVEAMLRDCPVWRADIGLPTETVVAAAFALSRAAHPEGCALTTE